ncbi:MAG: hypothetical protein GY795_35195 [Desulfobacterales bacterium]|nr:hypothetical protein [Desulfobacterales bacterium]
MKIRFFILMIFAAFVMICQGNTVLAGDENVTVITKDQKFANVRVVAIIDDLIRIKADYMKEEGLKLSREDVLKIIFPGGNEESKGIVLKGETNFNGTIKKMMDGKWFISIDGVKGELILEDGQLLSVNFTESVPMDSFSRGDENWKYSKGINILEWIYENDAAVFGKGVDYLLDIEKISLATNKITISSYIQAGKKISKHCNSFCVECTLTDENNNAYDIMKSEEKDIPELGGKKHLIIDCPVPKNGINKFVIRLRSCGANCGARNWFTLPAFNTGLLQK